MFKTVLGIFLPFVLLSLLPFEGVEGIPSVYAEEPLVIAVSVPPQKYFLEQLLGDAVRVLVVIPPNADHENYEPGIAQLEALSRADAFLSLGHPKASFEKIWLERLSELRGNNVPLKILSPGGSLKIDPADLHYWTSVKTIANYLPLLADDLSKTFPQMAPRIQGNLTRALLEVQTLEKELSAAWAPHAACAFLVFHGAWGAFAHDFQLRQLALEMDGREPGVLAVSQTIEDARRLGIHTLFLEPQRPASTVRAYLEELHAKAVVIDPLAADWAGNLRLVSQAILKACSETVPNK